MPSALIVADSEWVTNDVAAALAVDQWELTVLSDPREAVEMVAGLRPDVVIVDMQVGSMGGMAVIRAVRGGVPAGSLPRLVLLLDRSADKFIARRALADAAVLKPFSARDLRESMGRLQSADEEE
jgi:DNA-binding response OmpR family regulator